MLCRVMGVHKKVEHLLHRLGASWAHRLSKKSVAFSTFRCACYVGSWVSIKEWIISCTGWAQVGQTIYAKSTASSTIGCALCRVMGVHKRVDHLPQKLGASWAHRLSKKSVASYTVRCACYVRLWVSIEEWTTCRRSWAQVGHID